MSSHHDDVGVDRISVVKDCLDRVPCQHFLDNVGSNGCAIGRLRDDPVILAFERVIESDIELGTSAGRSESSVVYPSEIR